MGSPTQLVVVGRAEAQVVSMMREHHSARSCCRTREKKKEKSEWWMPGLKEAKKDVVSCEKLRGGANDL